MGRLMQKKNRIKPVKALRIETRKFDSFRNTKNCSKFTGAAARGRSIGAGLTARGLNQMEAATGFFEKLGIAAKYTRLQDLTECAKNMFKNYWSSKSRRLLSARLAFVSALGAAVRLFGTALLSAIPVIGQDFTFVMFS